jgi:hypothetical protein
MSALRAFGRFWYDFVIGDDWKLAAVVATVLLAGAVLIASGAVPGWLAATLIAAGMLGGFTLAMAVDVRRR